jgi:cellulose synthase/poly-beta-1,6-N-acetylglucosamine synthase-like glycosyltransferase
MIATFSALAVLSIATVFYVYFGFPLCLFLLTIGRKYRAPRDYEDDELPSVSLVVAAYNEELVIENKVRNCLAIDYPPEKLEFRFVSDSTDGTNEILRRLASERIHATILPDRRGKVAALAEVFPHCKRDVVVLSDANTYYHPDAIRKLVRHFRDPEVGVVSGDVRLLPSKEKFGQGEGLYYKYERKLQELESALWSTVGIDGAMYALRRRDLRPAKNGLIADDFVVGMNAGREGYRIVYDPEAIAEEDPTPSDGMEFRRKIRVVAYAIQSLIAGEGLPRLTQGRFLWVYVSHKLLRWLTPVFLLMALVSNMVLSVFSPWGLALLAAQGAFYACAVAGWRLPGLASRLFRVPYYFTMVNLAALFGLVRGVRQRQRPVWARTDRTVVEPVLGGK